MKHKRMYLTLGGFAAIVAALGIALASCGGDDDGLILLPRVNPNNALLTGDYQMNTLEQEWYEVATRSGSGTFDGKGKAIGEGTIKYDIADDRTITISPPSPAEKEYGIVSSDGNMAIVTDAEYIIPGSSDQDVETHIVMKKSSGLTMADVQGEYIVSQASARIEGAANAFVFATSQLRIELDNAGAGNWAYIQDSRGNSGGGNLTYTLNPTDGTFTVTTDPGGTDSGIFSPDGNMLIMMDSLSRDDVDGSDGLLAVGVKKSTSAPALSGKYQVHFIGNDMDAGAYWQFATRMDAVVDAANSEFDCTVLADSRGAAPGTTFPAPFTAVAADGTFTISDDGVGIVSPDGSFIAAVDTDNADNEIKLIFGLRY